MKPAEFNISALKIRKLVDLTLLMDNEEKQLRETNERDEPVPFPAKHTTFLFFLHIYEQFEDAQIRSIRWKQKNYLKFVLIKLSVARIDEKKYKTTAENNLSASTNQFTLGAINSDKLVLLGLNN